MVMLWVVAAPPCLCCDSRGHISGYSTERGRFHATIIRRKQYRLKYDPTSSSFSEWKWEGINFWYETHPKHKCRQGLRLSFL